MRRQTPSNDPVVQFASVCRRFCRVVENRRRLTKRAFVHQCAEWVAELQAGFVRLLAVKAKPGLAQRHSCRIPDEEWWRLFKSLGKKLGKDDAYYLVFDPYKADPDELVQTGLSDDLADIYRDVRDGLDLIDQNDLRHTREAVQVWRFNFLAHTGHHCTSALRALQELVQRYHEAD